MVRAQPRSPRTDTLSPYTTLCRSVQTAPGKYKRAGDYVPPSVALAASSNLLRWTRAMRDLLVSRGQDFAAAKRQRGIRAASTSAQEVVRIVMMQSFARHICAFQEHVRLGVVSPYPLYQELRQLVAEFSTFSEDTSYFGALREIGRAHV